MPDMMIRIKCLFDNIGRTPQQIANLFPDPIRDQELGIALARKKGSISLWYEWFIKGERPDNKPVPDLGKLELKVIGVRTKEDGSWKPKENMRLTIISAADMMLVEFENSHLFSKSKMLVGLYNVVSGAFLGFGFIDLTVPDVCEFVKQDYISVANIFKQGNVNELTSKKDQPRRYAKTYSSGNGKNLRWYVDTTGKQITYKGKAFYLFKDEIVELWTMCQYDDICKTIEDNNEEKKQTTSAFS